MKCAICKSGETAAGMVTVPLQRNGALIVFRDVPAQVCNNCGEHYLDDRTAAILLEKAEVAAAEGVEIDVRHFVAA